MTQTLTKKYPVPRAVVWLRRDFRLTDHPALSKATHEFEEVIPVFVFDPKIVAEFEPGNKPSAYFFGSLLALRDELHARGKKLILLTGPAERAIPEFVRENQVSAVFCHRDYEPKNKERDQKVANLLKKMGTAFSSLKDHVLFEPDEIRNQSGEAYKVFTAYKNACFTRAAAYPFTLAPKIKDTALADITVDVQGESPETATIIERIVRSGLKAAPLVQNAFGEKAALQRLTRFYSKSLLRYSESRNILADSTGTSHISADLRAGVLSPRQVWILTQAKSEIPSAARSLFLSEIIWRNFFSTLGAEFPHVFESNYNPKYGHIKWRNRESDFKTWCEGRTGYPVVDAGMRELIATGFMHNRARMITAMFLVKDLLIDWRWGEKFFRQHLIDGDHAINNGNWQWCASTGCDAQPYFRIFNPTTQGKRFDPEGVYIKKWIPELSRLDSKTIHTPEKAGLFVGSHYPNPIVDHATARIQCLKAYTPPEPGK